jgi:hypothetical protein
MGIRSSIKCALMGHTTQLMDPTQQMIANLALQDTTALIQQVKQKLYHAQQVNIAWVNQAQNKVFHAQSVITAQQEQMFQFLVK